MLISPFQQSGNLFDEGIRLLVDPGTVCLFRGGYSSIIPAAIIGSIPADSCEVPALQSIGE